MEEMLKRQRGVKSDEYFYLVCLKSSFSLWNFAFPIQDIQRCIKQRIRKNHCRDDNISFSYSGAGFTCEFVKFFEQIFCRVPPGDYFWTCNIRKKELLIPSSKLSSNRNHEKFFKNISRF